MKLSISNIAWTAENDEQIYQFMRYYGYDGLEIAPTRIFPIHPYIHIEEASAWSEKIRMQYGFTISSMQSIWYGKTEKIFKADDERNKLIQYTKQAVDFAEAIGCNNLVFGCPKNRVISDELSLTQTEKVSFDFFRSIGDYAYRRNTFIGMEANPPIYQTNFINDTSSALELIKRVNSSGFRLNLDVGTMIQNEESVRELAENVKLINHVHISEPGLKKIEKRQLHREIAALLKSNDYKGFISIEMGKQENISEIESIMAYVREIFG